MLIATDNLITNDLNIYWFILSQVSKWYDVVVFTAGLYDYANPIVDDLDPERDIVKKRFFRDVGCHAWLKHDCRVMPDLGVS